MKIKRLQSLLYIVSSIMVLGLALVSFDTEKPAQHTVQLPTPTPTKKAYKSTSVPTLTPTNTPIPTSTPSPTPSPTPLPSLSEIHATISISPATTEIGIALTDSVTEYLKNFYAKEELQVKEINNITCYYKQGIGSVDYFVYAAYDIIYIGSNVPIPALEEFLVTKDGETFTIHTESTDEIVNESLLLSRASDSVSSLYIKELIRRYMNAKLACDEILLASIVTDSSYLNIENIKANTMHIMEYRNPEYIIHTASDNVTEFDYITYWSVDVKISTLTTPLPGVDEFLIKLDEQNYPKIFLGPTSSEAESARLHSRNQEDFLLMYEDSEARLDNAIATDPDVAEFMNRLHNATEQ